MRIALYSPYVPEHVGGGERYFFSVAQILSKNHTVDVLVGDKNFLEEEVKQKYAQQFKLDLSRIHVKSSYVGTNASLLHKLFETLKYDSMYYLTDGSLFFSLARRNVLHIQFPFTFPKIGFVERLKLLNWSVKNTNSQFTKDAIERSWKTNIQFVHYPYVDPSQFYPMEKEKIILSVGRFFTGKSSATHCKRQDVLVEAFTSLCDEGKLKGWKLVLIGSIDPGKDNEEYAKEIAKKAKGYPVKIFHAATFDILQKYYGHASLYWHAAGYGVDDMKEPTRVEHFGISLLEAMSAGAVPVVVRKGGMKEIVEHGKNGYLWESLDELKEQTCSLIGDIKKIEHLSKSAIERSRDFSKEKFEQTLLEMLV